MIPHSPPRCHPQKQHQSPHYQSYRHPLHRQFPLPHLLRPHTRPSRFPDLWSSLRLVALLPRPPPLLRKDCPCPPSSVLAALPPHHPSRPSLPLHYLPRLPVSDAPCAPKQLPLCAPLLQARHHLACRGRRGRLDDAVCYDAVCPWPECRHLHPHLSLTGSHCPRCLHPTPQHLGCLLPPLHRRYRLPCAAGRPQVGARCWRACCPSCPSTPLPAASHSPLLLGLPQPSPHPRWPAPPTHRWGPTRGRRSAGCGGLSWALAGSPTPRCASALHTPQSRCH
mmetsp:Transcript_8454/g.22632  ORF Transcript_8454/g.22632 Transcript_8454/m.22632 type:complete len:280 (-) Transcript_8454:1115-1954(-)